MELINLQHAIILNIHFSVLGNRFCCLAFTWALIKTCFHASSHKDVEAKKMTKWRTWHRRLYFLKLLTTMNLLNNFKYFCNFWFSQTQGLFLWTYPGVFSICSGDWQHLFLTGWGLWGLLTPWSVTWQTSNPSAGEVICWLFLDEYGEAENHYYRRWLLIPSSPGDCMLKGQ